VEEQLALEGMEGARPSSPAANGAEAKPCNVLSYRGEDFKMTKDGAAVVRGVFERRPAAEQVLILDEGIRRFKAMRRRFGRNLWLCGVEVSSAELMLEERGRIERRRSSRAGA
jgi:hypothetical protein